MKEKIINYIETLEAKAYQSDYYFKQRNDLYISNQEKDKEIETHIKLNKQLLEDIDRAGKEIERLNNIIKEVREYIESYMPNYDFDKTNLIKLLEILDKVDKEK